MQGDRQEALGWVRGEEVEAELTDEGGRGRVVVHVLEDGDELQLDLGWGGQTLNQLSQLVADPRCKGSGGRKCWNLQCKRGFYIFCHRTKSFKKVNMRGEFPGKHVPNKRRKV